MNKIVIDKEVYDLEDIKTKLNYDVSDLTLNIKGNVLILDYDNNKDINLKIVLEDNSSLIYNRFNNDINRVNLSIEVGNNTDVEFNQSINETIKGEFSAYINIIGNNNRIVTNVYGLTTNDGSLKLIANGNVNKDIKNNIFLENLRILTLNDEENIIIPNLLVSSDEVEVNHNATISSVSSDYLFYLMSKGINRDDAVKLICDGFLFNKIGR